MNILLHGFVLGVSLGWFVVGVLWGGDFTQINEKSLVLPQGPRSSRDMGGGEWALGVAHGPKLRKHDQIKKPSRIVHDVLVVTPHFHRGVCSPPSTIRFS